jgi:hypothetical protein
MGDVQTTFLDRKPYLEITGQYKSTDNIGMLTRGLPLLVFFVGSYIWMHYTIAPKTHIVIEKIVDRDNTRTVETIRHRNEILHFASIISIVASCFALFLANAHGAKINKKYAIVAALLLLTSVICAYFSNVAVGRTSGEAFFGLLLFIPSAWFVWKNRD